MIPQKFISPFADADLVAKTLDSSPRLESLAFDFCSKFGTQLAEHPNANSGSYKRINVMTDLGITIGALAVGSDSDGEYYLYHSNFIKKERGSRRSDARSRDASKISTLLRTIASNGDVPDPDSVMDKFTGGLRYAYRAMQGNTNARLEVTNSLTIAMAEHILKINEDNLTNNLGELTLRYEEYAKQRDKNEKSQALAGRFAEGTTSIAIFDTGTRPYYVVCNTVYDYEKDKATFIGAPKRVNSLSEIPELISDIAIIRAYFETHRNDHDMGSNDLGAPRRDRYYEDIDIATGYSEAGMMWVILPKKAP